MNERVAIVGSRGWRDLGAVKSLIASLPDDAVVISGGALGVDSAAELFALSRGLTTLVYTPDWEKHSRKAGYMRNRTIVENADRVVAFWDGKSKGTQHTINIAKELGVPCEVYR